MAEQAITGSWQPVNVSLVLPVLAACSRRGQSEMTGKLNSSRWQATDNLSDIFAYNIYTYVHDKDIRVCAAICGINLPQICC